MTRVLVAYATTYGSTQDVADAVAAALRGAGAEVDLHAATAAPAAAQYDAVVVGGPLYMFHWARAARRFVARNRSALKARPVAVFAMGPLEDKPDDWTGARRDLGKALARFPWLRPVATEIFGGAFDPGNLRFPHTLIPALKQLPATDLRDWDAIREWAAGLVPLLSRS